VVIGLRIDLSKLLNTNLYKISVDEELIIPDEYLNGSDIKSITPVKVSGYVYNNEEELSLEIIVSGTMILTCARTLKDVEYPFNIEINEIIGENEDNSLEIVQNSLDIFPIVWQNILVDVPLRVLHPDAKEESLEGDGWRLITEDDKKEVIDPRLAKLKDYIKE
jgi:uncharacterized protein